MFRRRNANSTGWLVAQFSKRLQLRADAVKCRTKRGQEFVARLRGRDAPGRSRQQPDTQSRLQAPDGVAQRGLRCPELRGGPGKVPFLSHHHEGIKVNKDVSLHS